MKIKYITGRVLGLIIAAALVAGVSKEGLVFAAEPEDTQILQESVQEIEQESTQDAEVPEQEELETAEDSVTAMAEASESSTGGKGFSAGEEPSYSKLAEICMDRINGGVKFQAGDPTYKKLQENITFEHQYFVDENGDRVRGSVDIKYGKTYHYVIEFGTSYGFHPTDPSRSFTFTGGFYPYSVTYTQPLYMNPEEENCGAIKYTFTVPGEGVDEVEIDCTPVLQKAGSSWKAVNIRTQREAYLESQMVYSKETNQQVSTLQPGYYEFVAVIRSTEGYAFDDRTRCDIKGSEKFINIDYRYQSDGSILVNGVFVVADPQVTYKIIEGWNQKIKQGSEALFRSDAPFDKFMRVLVDGLMIDPGNYKVRAGSTIVELTEAFTDTLSVGEHELTIVSQDGDASTTFTVSDEKTPAADEDKDKDKDKTEDSKDDKESKDSKTEKQGNKSAKTAASTKQVKTSKSSRSPQTGDMTQSGSWMVLLCAAVISVSVLLRRKQA